MGDPSLAALVREFVSKIERCGALEKFAVDCLTYGFAEALPDSVRESSQKLSLQREIEALEELLRRRKAKLARLSLG